jgi:hypothetical protein
MRFVVESKSCCSSLGRRQVASVKKALSTRQFPSTDLFLRSLIAFVIESALSRLLISLVCVLLYRIQPHCC